MRTDGVQPDFVAGIAQGLQAACGFRVQADIWQFRIQLQFQGGDLRRRNIDAEQVGCARQADVGRYEGRGVIGLRCAPKDAMCCIT